MEDSEENIHVDSEAERVKLFLLEKLSTYLVPISLVQ